MNLLTPRRLVYAYVALVILEGALRKWFLPQALNPLLAIARDPIALLLLWHGYRHGLFQPVWLRGLWLASGLALALGGLLAMFNSELPLSIWLYGLRTNLLHFPLILIIPGLLEPADLDRLFKRLLALALPIALLMVWQYRSPLNSWINNSAIDGVKLLTAVVGKVRPTGPFSFNTGAAEYFALINAVLLGGMLDRRLSPPWIFYGLLSTVLAMSVSGSRLMFAMLGLVWAGSLIVPQLRLFRLPSLGMLLGLLSTAMALVLVLNLTPLGELSRAGWSSTNQRFETANRIDGGIFQRAARTLAISDSLLWQTPIFGHGLGLGTNFASKVVTGNLGFALAENEVYRVLLESGFLIGSLFLSFRLLLAAHVFRYAWFALGYGQQLAMALWFSNITVITIGQIGRPTSMGFAVLSMSFSLAAARWSPLARSEPSAA